MSDRYLRALQEQRAALVNEVEGLQDALGKRDLRDARGRRLTLSEVAEHRDHLKGRWNAVRKTLTGVNQQIREYHRARDGAAVADAAWFVEIRDNLSNLEKYLSGLRDEAHESAAEVLALRSLLSQARDARDAAVASEQKAWAEVTRLREQRAVDDVGLSVAAR